MAVLAGNTTVSSPVIFEDNATITTTDTYHESRDSYQGLVNDEDMIKIQMALEVVVPILLSWCGILGNVLSLITFAKLGYQDTVNISMSFICSWDLVRCICGCFRNLFGPVRLVSTALSLSWYYVSFVVVGYPAFAAVYVSGVLAGYVAVERCLCVSMPLTVKFLLTPKVVLVNNFVISFVVLISFLFFYIGIEIAWVFEPELNATLATWRYSSFYYENTGLSVYLTVIGTAWLMLSFIVTCVCTSIISYHLKKATAFKLRSTKAGSGGEASKRISARDRQVIKMLLVIIAVYIVVILPRIVFFFCRMFIPEFDYDGRETNLFRVIHFLASIFEYVNHIVNVVVFYSMSTQFKTMFRELFCASREKC